MHDFTLLVLHLLPLLYILYILGDMLNYIDAYTCISAYYTYAIQATGILGYSHK